MVVLLFFLSNNLFFFHLLGNFLYVVCCIPIQFRTQCIRIYKPQKSLMTLMTVTLMTGIPGRTKKTALLVLRRAVDLFMAESAYYNKVDSMFFIPCSSLLRA